MTSSYPVALSSIQPSSPFTQPRSRNAVSLPLYLQLELDEMPIHECYYIKVENGLESTKMVGIQSSLLCSQILVPYCAKFSAVLSGAGGSSGSFSSPMLSSLSISDVGSELGLNDPVSPFQAKVSPSQANA